MLAGLLALLVVFAFSGCFVLRTLQWSKDTIRPGRATTAKITLTPEPGNPLGRQFFILSSENELHLVLKRGRFDTKGELQDPVKMTQDAVLASEIVTNDECPDMVSPANPGEVTLIRTTPKIEEGTTARELIEARVKIKAIPSAPSDVEAFALANGGWVDDGDNIPEDGDDGIACSGGSTSTLRIK